MHTDTPNEADTTKQLECYTYTHAFSHVAPWPKCETEAALAQRLQATNFHPLPGGTAYLTSYRCADPYPENAYAVVINHADTRYVILCSYEAHYLTFMRNFAPVAGILDRLVPR